MSAIVKIKYVGAGENDLHPELTLNNVYTVFDFDGSVPGELRGITLDDSNILKVVRGLADPLIWELVSVTYPGEVQLYP